VRFLSTEDMFFHREFVRETNCRGEERFPVGLGTRLIRGADFPGGVANARLALKVRDHRVQVAWNDGGTDERRYDLQQIVAEFDDLQVGHRILGTFEPLDQAVAQPGNASGVTAILK
jgi:hypothetical protein